MRTPRANAKEYFDGLIKKIKVVIGENDLISSGVFNKGSINPKLLDDDDDDFDLGGGEYLIDIPFIFIDHNWYGVFNEKVSTIHDEEIVLPFPECIFEISYLESKPVVRVSQSSDTFGITLEVLSNTHELDLELLKQHILSACLSLELNIMSLPATAKVDMKITENLEFKGITYVMLPIRKSSPSKVVSKNTGTKQRLHIRRGHWKTIRGIKKRIKWYIAGDIKLGMIIKDYKID
ncbi:MAG: hypothetical protein RR877_00785 [Aurantimicrobium sp.]|uniref:hypothetical protein n=1 Tax=Aurantimicrobium sp. TaxID=1930784 RepID=UPI002FCB3DBB